MLKKIWNYFKRIIMAIAATPAGGGGLSSADRALIDDLNKIRTVLSFDDPTKLFYIYKDVRPWKITSITPDIDNGQTVDLGTYEVGDTVAARTESVTITVNKTGLVEVIIEYV